MTLRKLRLLIPFALLAFCSLAVCSSLPVSADSHLLKTSKAASQHSIQLPGLHISRFFIGVEHSVHFLRNERPDTAFPFRLFSYSAAVVITTLYGYARYCGRAVYHSGICKLIIYPFHVFW